MTVTPGSVFIAAGATAPATQPQINGISFGSVTINGSAPGFASASQTSQVAGTMSFSPPNLTVTATMTQNLTLTLSVPAPTAGFPVNVVSSNTGVAKVPSTVTFAPSATTVVVPVTGVSPGPATITASSGTQSLPSASTNVTVKRAADILLASGVSVGPGQSTQLAVTLNAPATRTLYVTLTSSDTSKVSVNPTNVIVLEGSTTPTLQPQVTGLDFGSATITASAFGLTGDSETVQVNASLIFGAPTQTISQGSGQMVFLSLSATPPSDQVITFSSDNPGLASVPATATIPANSNFTTVMVTGAGAGSTTIHAVGGPSITPASLSVNVVAPANIILSNVNLSPNQTLAFPLALSTPAPAGGVTVTLSSSNPSLVNMSPGSVFIPAGSTTPASQPQVSGVNIGSATITASAPGYATANKVVPVSATLTFSPPSLMLPAGSIQIVFLRLSTAAPPDGFFATLSSDNPGVADVQHTVGFFPDGSSVATNAVVINGISPGITIIHGGAPPFIPDTTMSITVVGTLPTAAAPQQ
jgi:trimeric autotransporter adhesin